MTTVKLTAHRLRCLEQARAGRLIFDGYKSWKRRGVRGRGWDRRTVGPMIEAGLLVEVYRTLEISDAGRRRLAELEGRS